MSVSLQGFGPSIRIGYWQRFVAGVAPNASMMMVNVVAKLMDESYATRHVGVDSEGNRVDMALATSVSKVSASKVKGALAIHVEPQNMSLFVVNQKPGSEAVATNPVKADILSEQYWHYVLAAMDDNMDKLPSMANVPPAIGQEDKAYFKNHRPSLEDEIPIVEPKLVFDQAELVFNESLKPVEVNDAYSSSIHALLRGDEEVQLQVNLREFLSIPKVRELLGNLDDLRVNKIINFVHEQNQDVFQSMENAYKESRRLNRFGLDSDYMSLPNELKDFADASASQDVANHRLAFLGWMNQHVENKQELVSIVKNILCLLPEDSRPGVSEARMNDSAKKAIEKIDQGGFPLSIWTKQRGYPALDPHQFVRAINNLALVPAYIPNRLHAAVNLMLLDQQLVRHNGFSVLDRPDGMKAADHCLVVESFFSMANEAIKHKESDPMTYQRVMASWDWVTESEPLETLWDIVENDSVRILRDYKKTMHESLDAIHKYASLNEKQRVCELSANEMKSVFDTQYHQISLLDADALFEKEKDNRIPNKTLTAFRTAIPDVPFHLSLKSSHRMAHTCVSDYASLKEAILDEVPIRVINEAQGSDGDIIFKLSHPETGDGLGFVHLSKGLSFFVQAEAGSAGYNLCDLAIKPEYEDIQDKIVNDVFIFTDKLNAIPQAVGFDVQSHDGSCPSISGKNGQKSDEIDVQSSLSSIPYRGLAGVANAYRLNHSLPGEVKLMNLVRGTSKDYQSMILQSGIINDLNVLEQKKKGLDFPVYELMAICAQRGIDSVDRMMHHVTKAPDENKEKALSHSKRRNV